SSDLRRAALVGIDADGPERDVLGPARVRDVLQPDARVGERHLVPATDGHGTAVSVNPRLWHARLDRSRPCRRPPSRRGAGDAAADCRRLLGGIGYLRVLPATHATKGARTPRDLA